MGILDRFRPAMPTIPQIGVGSPWTTPLTPNVVVADVWPGAPDSFPVSEQQALRVPAVVGARNLICSRLAGGVLRAFDGPTLIAEQPAWLTSTAGNVSPQIRLLYTASDLLLHGFALWATERDGDGSIVAVERVPRDAWSFGEQGQILVADTSGNHRPVGADEVILFLGADEGLLTTGAPAIRSALDIQKTVTQRTRNPVPTTILVESKDNPFADGDDARAFVQAFAAARRNPDSGSVVLQPAEIENISAFGGGSESMLEAARNASTLDIARLVGVPASLLEGTGTSASLTYSTTEMSRSLLMDVLRDRAMLIESRLSMDDVVPAGQSIRLDLSHLTRTDPGVGAETAD